MFLIQLNLVIQMTIPLTPGRSGITELFAISMYDLYIPVSIVGIFVVFWRI